MRVTQKMMVNNMIDYMAGSLESLSDLNEKIASGKALRYSSDDPTAVSSALSLKSSIKMTDAYQTTAETASEWMDATDVALGDMIDLGTDALNLIQTAMSDTEGEDELATIVSELQELLSSGVETANSTYNGSYLFAGFQTDVPSSTTPFTLSSDVVTYNGDNGVLKRTIGVNQSITLNIDGESTFMPLFNAISDAITAINNNDSSAMETAAEAIDEALNTVNQAQTTNGSRASQLENTITRLETTSTQLSTLLSTREDTDLAEAVSLLESQETTYETILEVSSRTVSAVSLFDYLA